MWPFFWDFDTESLQAPGTLTLTSDVFIWEGLWKEEQMLCEEIRAQEQELS